MAILCLVYFIFNNIYNKKHQQQRDTLNIIYAKL